MNKKLRRLMQPSLALYFVVMGLFCGAALILKYYILAAAEAGVTLLLILAYYWTNLKRRRALTEYLNTTDDILRRTSGGELPFPVAMLRLSDGEILWNNKAFTDLTELKETMRAQHVGDIFPDFSLEWLAAGKSEAPDELRFRDHRFHVAGTLVPDTEAHGGVMVGMIYLQDLTELLQVRDEYIRSRPMVSIVLVDNYEELTNNLPDAAISAMNAEINTRVNTWAEGFNGMLRRLERNRFLVLFEARELSAMVEDKFSLLESIREVSSPGGIAATVSIGIGKDGVDFREDYDFAALSIEMALSRGGDQAIIKDRYDFTFFGGRTKQAERRTKVKSRVVASSLAELMAQSSRIFVMGHKMADIDAIGAAAGVCCLCRKKGKKVNVVVDPEANAAGALLNLLKTMPEYQDCFMTGQDALLAADSKSLLIVVDTNRPSQVECKPLLESLQRVVVIDHHRRAADYIEQPVLNLHEPFASSASELVTELLQYSLDPSDIPATEAAALLAGIVLDTKNFGVRTSSRTFEAAAFLRRIGADTVAVKRLFQNDLDATVARYQIIQKARLYRESIAIAAMYYTTTRITAAQAADELINISGIESSFVLYPQDDRTIISARSIGDMNVQVVLEPLGGGGNASTAGAQIQGQTVPATLDALLRSIDNYLSQQS